MKTSGENKNALVTGASGFIGGHLVENLLRNGWKVTCLIRKSSSLRFLPVEKIELLTGDLREVKFLGDWLKNPVTVFHLAGRIKGRSRRDFFETNWRGTKKLLETVAERAKLLNGFIFVSSLAAAGPSRDGHPLREDERAAPISYYGESKLAAEEEVRRFSSYFPTTIIRPAAVYGPRDSETLRLIRMVAHGIRIRVGAGENLFSSIHVRDAAEAIRLSAEADSGAEGKTFFVSDGSIYSWEETFSILAQLLENRQIWLTLPGSLSRGLVRFFARVFPRSTAAFYLDKLRELDHSYWVCDTTRLTTDLDFIPEFQLKNGLENTIRWYRKQGWI